MPIPTVGSLSPSSVYDTGGQAVTITGTNFTGATEVTFGGVPVYDFTVLSSTSISCVTPAHLPGVALAVVTNASGPSTSAVSLTYTAFTPGSYQFPIPSLEVALTDPFSALPELVDITQWCLRIDTDYGRQHELQLVEAQTIKAVMDNVTGLFSPYNGLSPFVNLMPFIDSTLDQGYTGSWVDVPRGIVSVRGGGVDSTPVIYTVSAAGSDYQLHTGGSTPVTLGTPVVAGRTYTGFASFPLSLRQFATAESISRGLAR